MNARAPLIALIASLALSLLSTAVQVDAAESNSGPLGIANRRAERVEGQRFDKKLWAQPESHSLMNKRFPIQQWDKHFSSVGSKRAPITLKEGQEKQIFRTDRIERKEFSYEMSRWNERMADLHKKAGIQMDDQAHLVADQQLYQMMLQDTQQFRDMAEEVSLRDLNRYQFRRNRPDGGIPVEKAGSE